MYKKKYIKFRKSKKWIKEIFRYSYYYLMMCIIISDMKSVIGKSFLFYNLKSMADFTSHISLMLYWTC